MAADQIDQLLYLEYLAMNLTDAKQYKSVEDLV